MKIQFSYIFDEELERVYECFADMSINTGITFINLVSKLKFDKGERFDSENSEFTIIWKNYYKLKMVVENVRKEQFFKSYTNTAIYIDKIPSKISVEFNFFWNSIDEKTIFILDLIYNDEFFSDLYKSEFDDSDKIKICKNVEKYLNSIIKGLKIYNSVYINSSFDDIWKYMSNPKILFSYLFNDLLVECKDEEISLDTQITIYDKNSKFSEPFPLIKLKAEGFLISSKFCKLSFVSSKKFFIPTQKIIINIKSLDKQKALLTIKIKILECISHDALVNIRKLWKKKIIGFVNVLESNKKKHKLNENHI